MLGSYLIYNKFVWLFEEEQNMMMLCLRYLTFECFDPNLSDDKIQGYLLKGYYAFQDYAALHWVDHLESVMQFESATAPSTQRALSFAIEAFRQYRRYVLNEDIPQDMRNRCSNFRDRKYFETMLQLLANERKSRIGDERLSALGEVGNILSRIRAILEDFDRSNSLTVAEDEKLNFYYGSNRKKCLFHTCYYFHEGFLDISQRDVHLNRHERLFLCTDSTCMRAPVGFVTEDELKNHMESDHTDGPGHDDDEMDFTNDDMPVENELDFPEFGYPDNESDADAGGTKVRLRNQIVAAFDSLTRPEHLRRLEADTRIVTQLLP
jgi:hypothetical protein